MKQWYEELFTDNAEQYEQECFVHGTKGEVDFIESEISHDKSLKILDIGCGTGRHSIELTLRGYQVTGFDLSASQLRKAREKAAQQGLTIEFFQADARDFDLHEAFDLAIMLCEGAFPLMETDEMNYRILQNAYKSLKPGGKLIFTTLNGLFPLFHSVKDFINQQDPNQPARQNSFDLMTFRDHSTYEAKDDHGKVRSLICNERYYVPCELTWLLKSIGFTNSEIFGATLGAYSREDNLTTDHYEMLVIAEK